MSFKKNKIKRNKNSGQSEWLDPDLDRRRANLAEPIGSGSIRAANLMAWPSKMPGQSGPAH